jgi:hypothetical protein
MLFVRRFYFSCTTSSAFGSTFGFSDLVVGELRKFCPITIEVPCGAPSANFCHPRFVTLPIFHLLPIIAGNNYIGIPTGNINVELLFPMVGKGSVFGINQEPLR